MHRSGTAGGLSLSCRTDELPDVHKRVEIAASSDRRRKLAIEYQTLSDRHAARFAQTADFLLDFSILPKYSTIALVSLSISFTAQEDIICPSVPFFYPLTFHRPIFVDFVIFVLKKAER